MLSFDVTVPQNDFQDTNQVRLYSTTAGKQTQGIPHPRPVTEVVWRYSPSSRRSAGSLRDVQLELTDIHSGDAALFTITSDSTLRIFLPVVDSAHRLQLHLTIDPFTPLTVPTAPQLTTHPGSKVIWLDREVLGPAIKAVLAASATGSIEMSRLWQVEEEDWDLFLRVLADGSLFLTAVAVSIQWE
jgi:hypothetical protein